MKMVGVRTEPGKTNADVGGSWIKMQLEEKNEQTPGSMTVIDCETLN